MQDKSYVAFTKAMKKDYTILVPNMLPMQFKLIINILKTQGLNMKLLESTDPEIAEIGLRYTHNDTCYPAVLVIGQFMQALLSGEYDPHKTALIMFQTGGGCRASNYISLIRKALKKAGLDYVPVISFSFAGLEKHSGFKLPLSILYGMVYGVLYGDLLMSLVNQVRPYEIKKGQAQALADHWTQLLGKELGSSKVITKKTVRENVRRMLAAFKAIPVDKTPKVKVGIVGEIFVKYSPLANNELENFLVSEGAEVVVPGLLDFCLYSVYNSIMDYRLYGRSKMMHPFVHFAYDYLCKKKNEFNQMIIEFSDFELWTPFETVPQLTEGLISTAVKMGEGWLLTAEMIELANSGCKNIVCAQPFGCLPNHICGKGMMKPIKALYPEVNIVAIDYDAGASRVNQENRLKLMLANARL